jgi:hypothetical protein
MPWNNNQMLTFWTFTFSASMSLGNADFLATVLTMKIDDGGSSRNHHSTVASWALALPTCLFVLKTDFVTTAFTKKPNHKTFSLINEPIISPFLEYKKLRYMIGFLRAFLSVLRLWRLRKPCDFLILNVVVQTCSIKQDVLGTIFFN